MAKTNLTTCRTCDEPVTRFAKICPSCGTKGPTRCIWLALLTIVALCLSGYGLYLLWNS
jgi:RNA polymerase subunit RPABC4/transcription elongation factor Spt4